MGKSGEVEAGAREIEPATWTRCAEEFRENFLWWCYTTRDDLEKLEEKHPSLSAEFAIAYRCIPLLARWPLSYYPVKRQFGEFLRRCPHVGALLEEETPGFYKEAVILFFGETTFRPPRGRKPVLERSTTSFIPEEEYGVDDRRKVIHVYSSTNEAGLGVDVLKLYVIPYDEVKRADLHFMRDYYHGRFEFGFSGQGEEEWKGMTLRDYREWNAHLGFLRVYSSHKFAKYEAKPPFVYDYEKDEIMEVFHFVLCFETKPPAVEES
jgi:hypothetical protein